MKEIFGGFIVTLFKENFTHEHLVKLGLNEKQINAVFYVKEKITNNEYQSLTKTSERTASRDLSDLVKKQILKSSGVKEGGTFLTLV